MIRSVLLPTGEAVPALGQGTWTMGERASERQAEIASLRLGIDLGLTLIDTAEMYAEGGAEEIVGEALHGLRDQVFLVSKVYPHNASPSGVVEACRRSLRRLRTDRLDLYLLHWRGAVPIEETVAGFEELRRAGQIRHWGVSNFDTSDLRKLLALPEGRNCATNQILYNVTRRGPEFDLLPWMAERTMPVMAYSPVEQGRLPRKGALSRIAAERDLSPFQIALAWLLRRPNVLAIPKASNQAHVRENRGALDFELSDEELRLIDREFPPTRKRTLETL